MPPQCQHHSQLFVPTLPGSARALAPPWGRGSSPSPGLSSQVTPRGLGQRLLLPHTLALVRGSEPRQKLRPGHAHSSPVPTSLVGVSSRGAARLGSSAALTPARGLPSRPSLTGRRLGGRRWHRRARAAAVDDVVGDARVLGRLWRPHLHTSSHFQCWGPGLQHTDFGGHQSTHKAIFF